MAGVPVRTTTTASKPFRKVRKKPCIHTPACKVCRGDESAKDAPSNKQSAPASRRKPPRKAAEKPRAREIRSPETISSSETFGSSPSAESIAESHSSSSSAESLPPPRKLTAGLAQSQVIQAYMATQPVENPNSAHLNWLVNTKGLPLMSRALHVSTLAFCAIKIGRTADGAGVVQASRQWYATGLQELQKALFDPEQMYTDDTLAACVLLALYEVAECPGQSRRGYKSHHDGCAMLIKARGPEAHSVGLARNVFSTFRMMGVTEGLVTRHTFLSEPEWMTLPFLQRPKTDYERLVDLMLEIPEILGMGDEVLARTTPEQRIIGGLEILPTAMDLARRFDEFYADLDSAIGPLYWTNWKRDEYVPPEDSPFPVQYVFPNIEMASLLLYYWASRTLIGSVLYQLHRTLAPYEAAIMANPEARKIGSEYALDWTEMFDRPISDSFHALESAVHDVCQSVEYCLQQSAKWAGGTAVMAPLRIVIDTVGPWPEFQQETKYILRTLERLTEMGMMIVPYLSQVPTAYRGT